MKIFVYFIGKPRDAHANAMANEFWQRVSHYARAEMRQVRPDRFDPWARHPAGRKICLDPAGEAIDSRQFTGMIGQAEREGKELVFAIGGADGLPPQWRCRADELLSLSPLTFPHELARVMLCEQIYRAFTTLRGHPYPR